MPFGSSCCNSLPVPSLVCCGREHLGTGFSWRGSCTYKALHRPVSGAAPHRRLPSWWLGRSEVAQPGSLVASRGQWCGHRTSCKHRNQCVLTVLVNQPLAGCGCCKQRCSSHTGSARLLKSWNRHCGRDAVPWPKVWSKTSSSVISTTDRAHPGRLPPAAREMAAGAAPTLPLLSGPVTAPGSSQEATQQLTPPDLRACVPRSSVSR